MLPVMSPLTIEIISDSRRCGEGCRNPSHGDAHMRWTEPGIARKTSLGLGATRFPSPQGEGTRTALMTTLKAYSSW